MVSPRSEQSAIICVPTSPLVVRPQTKKPAKSSQKVWVFEARPSAPKALAMALRPETAGGGT